MRCFKRLQQAYRLGDKYGELCFLHHEMPDFEPHTIPYYDKRQELYDKKDRLKRARNRLGRLECFLFDLASDSEYYIIKSNEN